MLSLPRSGARPDDFSEVESKFPVLSICDPFVLGAGRKSLSPPPFITDESQAWQVRLQARLRWPSFSFLLPRFQSDYEKDGIFTKEMDEWKRNRTEQR